MYRKLVIFDLGRVFLNYDFMRAAQGLSAAHRTLNPTARQVTPEEILAVLDPRPPSHQSVVARFERGDLSRAEFEAEVITRTGLHGLPSEEFGQRYADIFWSAPEMIAFLRELCETRSFHLSLLSNTSEIHAAHCLTTYKDVLDLFDRHFFSYELQMAKPDPRTFLEVRRRIATDLRVDPDSFAVVFVDDKGENVAGARAAGYEHCVLHDPEDPQKSIEELRRLLF